MLETKTDIMRQNEIHKKIIFQELLTERMEFRRKTLDAALQFPMIRDVLRVSRTTFNHRMMSIANFAATVQSKT
jgi:hypothetical protein